MLISLFLCCRIVVGEISPIPPIGDPRIVIHQPNIDRFVARAYGESHNLDAMLGVLCTMYNRYRIYQDIERVLSAYYAPDKDAPHTHRRAAYQQWSSGSSACDRLSWFALSKQDLGVFHPGTELLTVYKFNGLQLFIFARGKSS